MEANFKQEQTTSKAERYKTFLQQYGALIENETELISVLANTTAALKEAFNFFWIGFYLIKNDQLLLGPFQGSVACYRIKKGRGVCGTAWEEETTQVVLDVEKFKGHIACSSLSKSEIVVPIICDGKVKAVLDIDSDELNTFDETDKQYLEQMVKLLIQTVNW